MSDRFYIEAVGIDWKTNLKGFLNLEYQCREFE